jgi:PTS system N-acetylgalactosamine-specific IIC component
MSAVMAKADKYADEANPKGIVGLNYFAMAALGLFFAIVVVLGLVGGSVLGDKLNALSTQYAWFMSGLGAAGGMMRYVGFAILLRIMLSNDLWGIYFAGFALATIIGKIDGLGGSALLIIAFIGIAVALYDFQTNVKMKSSAAYAPVGGGDDEDGI